MTSNIGSDDYNDALDTEVSPLLSAAGDEITFNEKLFARVKTVADGAHAAGLTAEQTRIVRAQPRRLHPGRRRAGRAGKAELGRINTALSNAFTGFGQKVVADENTWTVIPTEAGVAGLPASNKAAAAAAARSRNLQGWAIVNTRSSVDPFLTFADDRVLREAVWRKFVNRGDNGDANDTNATIAEIVSLRDRAPSCWAIQPRRTAHAGHHGQDPGAARDLMNRVWAPAKARVAEEVADMRAIAGHDIEPWDYLYFAEKVRKAEVRPRSERAEALFRTERGPRRLLLHGRAPVRLQFKALPPGPCRSSRTQRRPSIEVTDKATGRNVGLYYSDDYSPAGQALGRLDDDLPVALDL
jgi:peptidyl-dipeptidase Dcp